MAAVRHAYQRALLVPTAQLEALWRGYENFEMGGSNKQLARRLLDEWRPRYQAGGCGSCPGRQQRRSCCILSFARPCLDPPPWLHRRQNILSGDVKKHGCSGCTDALHLHCRGICPAGWLPLCARRFGEFDSSSVCWPPPAAARGLLREREERLAGLNRKAMALPPGRGGYTQQQQAASWRNYLAWEQGNPQQLDAATYAARWGCAGGGRHLAGRRACIWPAYRTPGSGAAAVRLLASSSAQARWPAALHPATQGVPDL